MTIDTIDTIVRVAVIDNRGKRIPGEHFDFWWPEEEPKPLKPLRRTRRMVTPQIHSHLGAPRTDPRLIEAEFWRLQDAAVKADRRERYLRGVERRAKA
jgi:hypothetical protein